MTKVNQHTLSIHQLYAEETALMILEGIQTAQEREEELKKTSLASLTFYYFCKVTELSCTYNISAIKGKKLTKSNKEKWVIREAHVNLTKIKQTQRG